MKIYMKYIMPMILWLITFSYCPAQKSTEMFIPVGQSPGLSGKYTVLGTVENFNAQDSILTLSTDAGNKVIKIKGQPKIWLDFSKLKSPNKNGTLNHVQIGLLVELKYTANKIDSTTDWIKIQMKDLD